MQEEYKRLVSRIKKYNAGFDFALLDAAYNFARTAHEGQVRVSGEPYIIHPLHVAIILAELELDAGSIIAGLLHDVVEDTSVTLEKLSEMFGDGIMQIVDGVTKLDKIPYTTKEEQQAENIRKMFLAMSKDIRVILIKLADRLHNMRTMLDMPEEHRRQKAKETLEIYAPLANRLGIFKLQSELEDLCFKYMEPAEHDILVNELSENWYEREAPIADIARMLERKLAEIGIKASIEYRMKHLYSIYKKMVSQGKQVDQIYDIFAIRIIVNLVSECYMALGKVHEEFKPIPNRLKDYIAMPKHNQYQSLHTTLVGDSGTPFEVQIRTWDMHRVAEFGIAAHWRYKENYGGISGGGGAGRDGGGKDGGGSGGRDGSGKDGGGRDGGSGGGGRDGSGGIAPLSENDLKLSWLRQLIEWQRDLQDAGDFVESLKIDLFADEVFVFTPKGDVYDMPNGSTPIDFAYRVHSAIGNRMNGARVNGRIVPISYLLQNGDIVEIITSSTVHGPSRDWLDIVKSSQAKSKIKQWFKRENRDENIVRGKELVERELRRMGYAPAQLFKPEWVQKVLSRYNFNSLDDAYSAIGYEGISASKIVLKLVEEYRQEHKVEQLLGTVQQLLEMQHQDAKEKEAQKAARERKAPPESGILVKGIDNCLVRLSRCCNPVPGDPIIGYITRARGVSVHRADCVNAITGVDDTNRLIEVSWYVGAGKAYPAELSIVAKDRDALLSDITSIISASKIPLIAVNAKSSKDNFAMIRLTLEINDRAQLESIIKRFNGVESVLNVTRGSQ
ncbi:MAG: bifunctional (p)ppGpp synthetase/guanosine-3',5'-bis(diphosphate) 3'-pyrophosphohydrolase [Clostridiales bacterium]|jgi:GTP pyrophosphokinase|nr:bifunctional (p)ppGpp synthetase/guanosine-3',5'-bis(diphosphate) 3'-pyrophosphohydrolase [Clostridiales bacterium]